MLVPSSQSNLGRRNEISIGSDKLYFRVAAKADADVILGFPHLKPAWILMIRVSSRANPHGNWLFINV